MIRGIKREVISEVERQSATGGDKGNKKRVNKGEVIHGVTRQFTRGRLYR